MPLIEAIHSFSNGFSDGRTLLLGVIVCSYYRRRYSVHLVSDTTEYASTTTTNPWNKI